MTDFGSAPLAGLRVLDCSHGTAGPRATALLSDYGAEVVWIERPGGDRLRTREPATVAVFGRGKRSITVDLKDAVERQTLISAVQDFDVFVESWKPGLAAELGVGYEALRKANPSLVYCSISGFGTSGRYRDIPGYEALVHALVGSMSDQFGHRDGPIFEGVPFASIGASYLAVIGILAALYRRELDGRGRCVDTSLYDGVLAYLSMLWGETDESAVSPLSGQVAIRQATADTRVVTQTFECADAQFIGIHTGAVGAFGRLLRVLGLDGQIPFSADGMDIGKPLTPDERQTLDGEAFRMFRSKPRHYWIAKLLDADVCAIEQLHPGEAFDEAQVRHNQMIVEIQDPVLGAVQEVAPPLKLSRTPAPQPKKPAPRPGQDGNDARAIPRKRPWTRSVGAEVVEEAPLLDGLKILDLGAYYAGPYSSRLLADLGADVIKLEPPRGDQLRGIERPFFSAQAGKRSIAIDLKAPDAVPVVRLLFEWADVVHHNMRPGAAERLGIDYQAVCRINPNAIYLYAPGWGSTGPDRVRQSFAPMLSGYAGVTFEVAGRFNEPLPPVGDEDTGNGLLGAVAILLGLLVRRREGVAQYIENPQLNATLTHMAHIVRTSEGDVIGAERLDAMQQGLNALERLYMTSDGWVCVVAQRDEDIAALGQVTGLDILADSRFADEASRSENDDELCVLLERAFQSWSTSHLLKALEAEGVAAAEPVGPNVHALMNDPEQRLIGRIAEVGHPRLGRVREVATLIRVSGTPAVPHRLAPGVGEHTDSILRELGYDDTAIGLLRAVGALQ